MGYFPREGQIELPHMTMHPQEDQNMETLSVLPTMLERLRAIEPLEQHRVDCHKYFGVDVVVRDVQTKLQDQNPQFSDFHHHLRGDSQV